MLLQRQRIILYLAIAVILFTFGFNFFITPIVEKNNALNKQIDITRRKLNRYLQLVNKKEYIQNKYSKFYSGPNFSNPQEDKLVSTLSELENLAKISAIRILDIRPQAADEAGSYKEVSVELQAEGSMEGYMKFIYELENSPSLFKIIRYRLNTKPSSSFLEGSFSISKPL